MRTIAERYQLVAPIGRGGMGQLWEGLDLRLNRQVAVKLIATGDLAAQNQIRRRFYREARITARFRHPGVPAIYDYGDDGDLFMVMELVVGEPIDRLRDEQGALPVPWATYIVAQVCAVLAAAHSAGLVHRDIKPDNLMLCPNGLVKVVDFGVATSIAGEFSQITEPGEIPGSARYTAPELFDGVEADRASDLYTVGCVLYELLTGRRPFASKDLLTEINRCRTEDPPPMDDVPGELEELTRRLLAKDPARRPPDAASVYWELRSWARKPPPLPGWVGPDVCHDPVHMYSALTAELGQ
ncbi:serine/threonine-protein kinase [uncultured Thermomonospora sp.]|uniref:serine/threonine-protein kinase n=1 Tax=uncultured Thermomonospora sp. TaxID=671175 RepID=UPI00259B1DA3|nr:serine/threonine-protein kinase [uncultured Thermomonospora sp.]